MGDFILFVIDFCNKYIDIKHWWIQGAPLVHGLPPNRINFFHFHIQFCRKVYALEVSTPPTGQHPPMGNPGSTTVKYCDCISFF